MTAVALHEEEFDVVLWAARGGKGWAFERLFHLVAQPLVGYFRAEGSPDPDGLANETMLRAFRSITNFEGSVSGFRAWVFSIARCRLIDERRARARRPRCDTPLDSGDPSAGRDPVGGCTETEALDRLGDDWVRGTLDQLGPDQRDVLVLRIVADLSIEQVGAVLGKTPGAVKALQHRGIAAIRRNFAVATVSL